MAAEVSSVRVLLFTGASIPASALAESISDGGYGFPKTGFTIGAEGAFNITRLPVAITVGGSIQRFTSDGSFLETIGPAVYMNRYDANMQITTLRLGVQYDIFNANMISPYLSADLHLSLIDAERTFDLHALDPGTTEMRRATRFGAGFGAGARIHLTGLPLFLDLSGRYGIANLSGRQQHNPANVWNLEDQASDGPTYNHNDRLLSSVTILVGFGFSL